MTEPEVTATDVPLDLVGATLDAITISHQLDLRFSSGTSVSIETSFTLTLPDGTATVHDPEEHDSLVAPLRMLHDTVGHARVDLDVLTIGFDDGTVLTVGPHPDFESWHHHTTAGSRMIGLPGGGVSIWLPRD
jgi:hypothetical protein